MPARREAGPHRQKDHSARPFRNGHLAEHARTAARSSAARVHQASRGRHLAIGHIPSSRYLRTRTANRGRELFDAGHPGTCRTYDGGARRDRTDDLMLAKHALSQLSYVPKGHASRSNVPSMVGLGRLERPTSPLSGVRSNHLSYRPEPAGPHHAPKAGGRTDPACPDEKGKRGRRRPARWDLTGPWFH